jgi:hypothetical protein
MNADVKTSDEDGFCATDSEGQRLLHNAYNIVVGYTTFLQNEVTCVQHRPSPFRVFRKFSFIISRA